MMMTKADYGHVLMRQLISILFCSVVTVAGMGEC